MNRVYLSRLTTIGPNGMGLIASGIQSWQELSAATASSQHSTCSESLGCERPQVAADEISSGPGRGEEMPKLKASWFFKEPFIKFGRMDRFTQLVLAISRCCLNEAPIDGMVLGSAWGSIHQDQIHCANVVHKVQTSPAIFTYTLPSVALGELSILHQHHGENIMVEAAETSGLQALYEGYWMVRSGRVKQCLIIAADYIDAHRARAWACLLNAEAGDLEILRAQSYREATSSQGPVGLGDAGFDTIARSLCHRISGEHHLKEASSQGHILEFCWIFHGE